MVMEKKLEELLCCPQKLRNICIAAHVDHGKTSLADALIASNGIINPRQAGKIRYMDSRKDEIERGITMKSSCVTLLHSHKSENFVINLIDSPGHVDFSSEVSTAVRLCDGTIIVIDVVEGVCAQTKVVLRQAWLENIQPVLVLNKIDRLILETKLSCIDAYYHINQVLEQVNAYMGELHNTDVFGRMAVEAELKKAARERRASEKERRMSESQGESGVHIYDSWTVGDEDDSHLYFSPEHGNVVFASAYDGWGFSIHHFADQFASKLGMSHQALMKTLWGDYYITSRGGDKKIMKGARDKRKNPLFVTLILDNLYKLYDTVMIRKDKEETAKISKCLGVKLPASITKSTDARNKLSYICSSWLPLAGAVLDMVVDHLPSAASISEERAVKLMCSATQRFESLPSVTQDLKRAFVQCSSSDEAPLIVYVSKMFGVERKNLPQNSKSRQQSLIKIGPSGVMSEEEIAARRELIRRHKETATGSGDLGMTEALFFPEEEIFDQKDLGKAQPDGGFSIDDGVKGDEALIAFARVFSGSLRPGQQVYVLGPKHDPSLVVEKLNENGHLSEEALKYCSYVSSCHVSDIYLLVGREMRNLSFAPAGAVIGIAGLEEEVIKSATLSSTPACPPFMELIGHAVPILRVAVEPKDPKDLPKLRNGLKLLNQADPCVQVLLEDSGEYVMVTAGEVHLQRCVDDLEQRYAHVPVHTSEPIVPFRETIIIQPTVDRLNEMIQGENIKLKKGEESNPLGIVKAKGKAGTLHVRAVPLPAPVTNLLEDNINLLRAVMNTNTPLTTCFKPNSGKTCDNHAEMPAESLDATELPEILSIQNLSNKSVEAISELKEKLNQAFQETGPEWGDIIDRIWSFGPNYCGCNLLINRIESYPRASVWEKHKKILNSRLSHYDTNFVTGFQLATAAGPLCEEPMAGVGFIVEEWQVEDSDSNNSESKAVGGMSGHVISLAKDTLRRAFECQPQRLVCAMYSCVINVTSEVVGRVYSVIGRRHGRVVDGDITEGSTSWNVTAYLPVIESMNIANELRKATSGEAMPQLVFSHWETMEMDPFWEPQTTEELTHWGEKADSENIVRRYISSTRKRKGLFTDDKIVEFAEKQRTLSKNK